MSTSRILPANRREQILSLIQTHGSVTVSDVAENLSVSPITIRRDISLLAKEGLIEQVRGGARLLPAERSNSVPTGLTIGVITPSLDFYWPAIIDGANQAADEINSRLLLQGSTFAARDNLEQLERLSRDSSIDGLLLVPDLEGEGSDELITYLQDFTIPIVLIERSLHPRGKHSRMIENVITDHHAGGDMAVRHLSALGHVTIALVTDKLIPSRREIRNGWRKALSELQLDENSPYCDTTELTGRERSRAIRAFVDRCIEEDVTAFLVHSDEAALVVNEYIQSRKLSIPDDISIVSYDDELSRLARPALTAIAPPKKYLGMYAMRTLVNRIANPDSPLASVQIVPTLIVRNSTAAPRTQ
ncbi:MAG: LacI family DNA-binding transcriptional regulator [Actinomycetaceae bacterium]|nr:LacI family DNA-binding transcriptional regulator [Actinomycetaceae bacterium]